MRVVCDLQGCLGPIRPRMVRNADDGSARTLPTPASSSVTWRGTGEDNAAIAIATMNGILCLPRVAGTLVVVVVLLMWQAGVALHRGTRTFGRGSAWRV